MNTLAGIRKGAVTIIVAIVMILACLTGVFAQVADFSEYDDNTYSPRKGTYVSPYDATNLNAVTMWYHQYNEF